MTLHDLLQTIRQSEPSDWNVISCFGSDGPSFLEALDEVSGGGEPTRLTFRGAHHMRASYIPDVSIGLASGFQYMEDFREPWANGFTDPHATASLLDIFYNGMLVERVRYVVVDGGRATLPIPRRHEADDGTITYSISPEVHELFTLIDRLESQGDLNEYLRRAGIVVQP